MHNFSWYFSLNFSSSSSVCGCWKLYLSKSITNTLKMFLTYLFISLSHTQCVFFPHNVKVFIVNSCVRISFCSLFCVKLNSFWLKRRDQSISYQRKFISQFKLTRNQWVFLFLHLFLSSEMNTEPFHLESKK